MHRVWSCHYFWDPGNTQNMCMSYQMFAGIAKIFNISEISATLYEAV